jgi:hypothetical protein
MILATIAAPTGILEALTKRAEQRNESRAKLLSRAGITADDWTALETALGSANAVNLRKLLNASQAMLTVLEATMAIPEGSEASHGASVVSHFGDLS